MTDFPDSSNKRIESWLPYAFAGIGILAVIVLWFCLINISILPPLSASIIRGIELLILFFLLAILIGICILFLLNQRQTLLGFINQNLNKEKLERMQVAETKQKLEKAFLQGQKLQAIGTLAGGIAHNFNNILYAIIGYTEMAREDVDKNSIIYNNLGNVLEAANRGQQLISRILTFSRRQHQTLKPIKVQATIESVLSLLKPTIPASVDLDFQPMPEDCIILGDQTELHQVLVNIINNAVDAMDGEGTIIIRINKIDTHNKENKKYCKIDIVDTGHGMDHSTIERIFEPFFTTKEVGKGTGLGLSTVHSIITEHQGEITVSSKLGKGSTFTLLLPIYKGR